MIITKKEFIEKLYEIEEKKGIKTGNEVQKVVRNEVIPIEVIKLINKYDKRFLQIYDTYNVIYLSRDRNPLYRNLRNDNLSVPEKAIALSSLVTKILISCSKIQDLEERLIFAKAMDVEGINRALTFYLIDNDNSQLLNYSKQISDLLHILYSN